MARKRGCDGQPAPAPVLEEEDEVILTRYWNCPSLFIPQSIHTWYKMYKYHKDFPGASMANVDSQNSRFLQAYYLYEGHLAEFQKDMAKTR